MSDAATSVGYDAADEFGGRSTPLQRVQSALHQYAWLSPLAVLILGVVVMALLSDGKTNTLGNFGTIIQQTAVVGALAVGQTLIIMTAGIDLSCAQIMVFATMMMASLSFNNGVPGLLAMLLAVLASMGFSTLNGLFVTKVKLPPFIVTLGTLYVFQGIKLKAFSGRSIQNTELNKVHLWLGHVFKFGDFRITTGVIVMLGMYAVFAYILRYTAWGTHVYAVGDDPDAARLAGINTNRVILSVWAVAGLVYGITAWISIGRVQSAAVNAWEDANLQSITAAVVGGTSLFGGRGRIIGSLLGALIVVVVNNGLEVAGYNQGEKVICIGALIIGAVALDRWIRKARV